MQNENAGPFAKKLSRILRQRQPGCVKNFWRARKGILSRAVRVILTEKVKGEKELKVGEGIC